MDNTADTSAHGCKEVRAPARIALLLYGPSGTAVGVLPVLRFAVSIGTIVMDRALLLHRHYARCLRQCSMFAVSVLARLTEAHVLETLRQPLWAALVDPRDDTSQPPIRLRPPVTLFICKRHPGAWDDDLIEVLVTMKGRDMHIFHVEHITDRWRSYWKRYKDHGQI